MTGNALPRVDSNRIASSERHSPCVGICKLDHNGGYCLGCARSRDEIALWPSLSDDARDAVWDQLPDRLASFSIGVGLMPWNAAEILNWVTDTIANRLGTWVTGMPGAVAEFPCGQDRDVAVTKNLDSVVGSAYDALFRLRFHDKLRAFAFTKDGPIVLGLPKTRLQLSSTQFFTALGADRGAIDPENRHHALFDFGLGRKYSRFCIRTDNDLLTTTLNHVSGHPWPDVFAQVGKQILAESPHRVVESTLARIEVFSLIPPPGGSSPAGAHTHFLPQFLSSGAECPPSLALPEHAAPIAIFYPGPHAT